VRKRGELACFRTSQVGRTIGWSVFVLVAPCSVGPARVSAEDFRSVGASQGASPLQLSVVVRISHERGDFCRRVAVDFVRKAARQSLELRAAQLVTLENLSETSLPTSNWPHSHGPEPDWLNAVNDGELVELDCQHPYHAGHTQDEVELLVPVRSEDRVTHMLTISPGPVRRGLLIGVDGEFLVHLSACQCRVFAMQEGLRIQNQEQRLIVFA
jgi:hypothetical protein